MKITSTKILLQELAENLIKRKLKSSQIGLEVMDYALIEELDKLGFFDSLYDEMDLLERKKQEDLYGTIDTEQ